MKRRGFAAILAVLVCLVLAGASAQGKYRAGDTVEDFTLTLTDGTSFTLSEALAEKQAVLINFWASWCGPCRMEMPALDAAYLRMQDKAAFLCLSVEPSDTPEKLDTLKKSLNLEALPLDRDTDGLFWQFDNPQQAIPLTVILDRGGVIRYSEVGAQVDPESFVELLSAVTGADSAQEAAGEESYLNPDGTANYFVRLVDRQGKGIEHAMVQICSSELCRVVLTDVEGTAVMTAAPYPYEAHILEAEGYQVPDRTFVLPENGGVLELELEAD